MLRHDNNRQLNFPNAYMLLRYNACNLSIEKRKLGESRYETEEQRPSDILYTENP